MEHSRAIQVLRLTSLAFASLAFGTALAEPPPAVKVDVFAQHSGGKIVYYYRVFNNSQQDIAAVSIGHDTLNDENPNNDIYELLELPSGWNPKFGIPSTTSNSPAGWRVNVSSPEESSTYAITWEPVNENTPRLPGGQILAKMRVAVDQADANYLTGHARVTYTEGNPLNLTVPLERLDNTPPSLTINLNPNVIRSPDNKLIPVRVSFAIKDDYDLMPEIKLESITANEPLGPDDIRDASIGADDRYLLLRAEHKIFSDRIYTVTYSATDASGNQTIASADVTVTESTAPPVTATLAASAPVAASAAASAPVAAPAVTPAPATKPIAAPAPVAKPATAPQNKTETKKPAGKN